MPEVWTFYRDEVQKLGRPDPGPSPIGANQVVALAEDPEEGWEQMAPYFLHETKAYGAWQAQDDVAAPYHRVADIDALRATDQYRVLTPEEFVEEQKASPFPFAMLPPAVRRHADRVWPGRACACSRTKCCRHSRGVGLRSDDPGDTGRRAPAATPPRLAAFRVLATTLRGALPKRGWSRHDGSLATAAARGEPLRVGQCPGV